ncbi:Transducin/WD40 repeat superfamily protein [Spatholobus suberectus]|nr:Transducin/WD40 repeat superfamily protein [Spatholobus suberectus]
MMKGQCMPRLKSPSCKNKTPSPMTLLERFREAVLRLMMVTALSKATNHNRSSGDGERQNRRYSPYDPHHTEAVADCIEFIKKKAATDTG